MNNNDIYKDIDEEKLKKNISNEFKRNFFVWIK